MRLLDTCLLSLSAASFIIGVHQIITVGFAQGYWLIMISSGLFLWFSIRKRRDPANSESGSILLPRPSKKEKTAPSPSRQTSSRRASSRRNRKKKSK